MSKKLNLVTLTKKEMKEAQGGTIMQEIKELVGCSSCGSIFVVFGLA